MKENDKIAILIPVFNDWRPLNLLLLELDKILTAHKMRASVFIVDDGSIETVTEEELSKIKAGGIEHCDVIRLGTNLGHQRAIAIGLSYIKTNILCNYIVVMDSDGQDNPKDVPLLLKMCKEENDSSIIFAERTKRSEGIFFIAFYLCYKQVHKIFTGISMKVGNFCVLPYKLLNKVTFTSEIWNHFSAGIIKNRIPYKTVPIKRGQRLSEDSKMNFTTLITHGLRAVSVYADVIGIRALVFVTGILVFIFVLMIFLIGLRLTTDLAITGWTSMVLVMLMSLVFQLLSISFLFVFIVLCNRTSNTFLPIRDYYRYILDVKKIF